MTGSVFICVPGEPVPKGRPQFTTRHGFAQAITPKKTKAYESLVREEAKASMGDRPPLAGPLVLKLEIYVPIRKSWPKKAQEDARNQRVFPTNTKDWDNYAKAVCDALNRVVYEDDAQIVEATVIKRYSDNPCIIAIIAPLEF